MKKVIAFGIGLLTIGVTAWVVSKAWKKGQN
jgi:hypothetical protein